MVVDRPMRPEEYYRYYLGVKLINMPNNKGFNFHSSRSQLEQLEFGECDRCQETVIRSTVKNTQKREMFDPKPTGGTEIDPGYSVHSCRRVRPDE